MCNCSGGVIAGLDSSLLSRGLESSSEVVTRRKLIRLNTLWDGYVENVLFYYIQFLKCDVVSKEAVNLNNFQSIKLHSSP